MDEQLRYNYKCSECNKPHEIYIDTSDIMEGQKKIINNERLQERIDEKRFCECGGELKKILSFNAIKEVSIFNYGCGVRKQRFA